MVQLVDLRKSFGKTTALDGVSFTIGEGEVFGYLGPNGAGKTTTIRVLMGMLRPSAGRAEILGRDAWRQSVEVRKLVGYVPGEPALYDRLTGRDHISFCSHLRRHGADRTQQGSTRAGGKFRPRPPSYSLRWLCWDSGGATSAPDWGGRLAGVQLPVYLDTAALAGRGNHEEKVAAGGPGPMSGRFGCRCLVTPMRRSAPANGRGGRNRRLCEVQGR
jgi:ABC-type sugar transport system ATPase subunit